MESRSATIRALCADQQRAALHPPGQRELLLCPPDFFGIEYEINPWMSRSRGADVKLAHDQWQQLRETLAGLGTRIELLPPQPKLPDLVFTANAGLVVDHKFIPSHFLHAERQVEEKHFEKWFTEHGYEIVRLPVGLFFEGEGDALFWGDVLFCGYRFRSDIRAHQFIGDLLGKLVISVELVDARFYHLDTCFCPLPDGGAAWFPDAFDDYGQRAIRHQIPQLIDVPAGEALRFACNAVVLGQEIVLPDGCPEFRRALVARGLRPHELPMSEFMKAGGACKCLTLFLT